MQKDRDDYGRFMNIRVKYPQLIGPKNLKLDEVNRQIVAAAFFPLCEGEGKTVEETVAALEKEQANLSMSTACDIDYQLLHVGEQFKKDAREYEKSGKGGVETTVCIR